MALFVKQDFSPSIFSRRWLSMKIRPNMLIHSKFYVTAILESGLMFREDSRHVESEFLASCDAWSQNEAKGWMTTGEQVLSVLAIGGVLAAFPPKLHVCARCLTLRVATCVALPLSIRAFHRLFGPGAALPSLICLMKAHLTLTRRTIACLKEYRVLHKGLNSVSNALDSTQELLYRQQSSLASLMARCSSAILGNFPWLREDVDWDALTAVTDDNGSSEDLVKIHHAFLVIQSSLLKHIGIAHTPQSVFEKTLYKHHNERLYWLHTQLLENLKAEFKESHEKLDRMYRLLKNFGNNDTNTVKKSGIKYNDGWTYSDVHNGIAKASIELKVALQKCNALDLFLDSCSINQEEIKLELLSKDIEILLDKISKCLVTVQNSQLKLNRLQNKLKLPEVVEKVETDLVTESEKNEKIIKIGDTELETKDEVFFFIKTEEDEKIESAGDLISAPGDKEKENTKVVLNELKRKLVKREDLMRERERQALVKTMPELKDKPPEFPRQMIAIQEDGKGIISKILGKLPKKPHKYKINSPIGVKRSKFISRFNTKKLVFQNSQFKKPSDIPETIYDAKTGIQNFIKVPITFSPIANKLTVTKWYKIDDDKKIDESYPKINLESKGMGENDGLNVETKKENSDKNESDNQFFSKRNLELSLSSDSDFENVELAKLKDIRRQRVARKKKYPMKKGSISLDNIGNVDESLKPVTYSFGTGMAMASVLQVNKKLNIPKMEGEEVFIGDGEVSNDSGNDESA